MVYSGFNKGYGNVVIVKNDTGDYSLYGHMQNGDRAALGQRIRQGDTLGLVGSTGRSTGNHLHYSVIPSEAGAAIEKSVSRNGGPIGVKLNDQTTLNLAGYDIRSYPSLPR